MAMLNINEELFKKMNRAFLEAHNEKWRFKWRVGSYFRYAKIDFLGGVEVGIELVSEQSRVGPSMLIAEIKKFLEGAGVVNSRIHLELNSLRCGDVMLIILFTEENILKLGLYLAGEKDNLEQEEVSRILGGVDWEWGGLGVNEKLCGDEDDVIEFGG